MPNTTTTTNEAWNLVKDNVFLSLHTVDYARENRAVSLEIDPIALVPRILISTNGLDVRSSIVTHTELSGLDVSQEMLLAQAIANSQNLFKPVYAPLDGVLFVTAAFSDEPLDQQGPRLSPFGAAALFYEGVLEESIQILNSNTFYIIPTSNPDLALFPMEKFSEEDIVKLAEKALEDEQNVRGHVDLGRFILKYERGSISRLEK